MKKRRILIGIIAVVVIVSAVILLFPKEEELYTKPVIEAYQNDELEFVEVKQGNLVKTANLSLSVTNIGEKQLSFSINDLAYEGIFVEVGDTVTEGQVLASLSSDGKEEFVADSSKLDLVAPFDGIVTYVAELAEDERSLNNKPIVIVNKSDTFAVNTFTPYWNYFKPGDVYKATILGKEMDVKVVDATELGLDKVAKPTEEGAFARVYFTVKEEDLYLYAGIPGNLEITLDKKDNVLYIPSRAINVVNGEEIVYVENADGIRSILKIKTGLDTGNQVEVTEGLSLGDKVIVD